jgi:lysine 2,3-aminomutase
VDACRSHWDTRVTAKLSVLRFGAGRQATKSLMSVDDLVAAGLVAPDRAPSLRAVEARYSVALTPDIAALIDASDPKDPIAKQFLPDERELSTKDHERADPIGDDAFSPVEGLVHRYRDRVLLKLLSVCPIYCRFCFRRETVGRGKGDLLSEEAMGAALAYIASNRDIFEVILTGGDPLALSARRLQSVAAALADIAHVRLLRIHTRTPIAAPELVSAQRLDALRAGGKTLYVAVHVNHWRELTPAAKVAIARMQDAGASVLAQTVLLAGVNDDADTLERLMRELVALKVKPYYLHHPDLAPGTAHFRLGLDAGRRLYEELARRVSGVALPAYMLDIPGGFGKVPAQAAQVVREQGGWGVCDRSGATHFYPGEG